MSTIAAIATPPGRGGVGIVRVSGPKALEIACQLSVCDVLTPRFAHFTTFFDAQKNLLDLGILIYFKAPHSFTGEDVVEFHAHGSPVVLDLLLAAMVTLGAELAKPGEFSLRAFLNDKMDLTQAESIADLIDAESSTAARMALRSLQGDFSKQVSHLNQSLISLRLYVEASLDFPEEEIDFLADGAVAAKLSGLQQDLYNLLEAATQGVIIKEGLTVVIAGKPNAGKSTLMNTLSGKDVAIVTPIAGTTRDVMREHVVLDGIPLHVVDTAGLRQSECLVEQEGIKRAKDELTKADCVLVVIDANEQDDTDDILASVPDQIPVIQVFNKIDQCGLEAKVDGHRVWLSLKTGEGLEFLSQVIKSIAGYKPSEGQFLARRRHLDALQKASALLVHAEKKLTEHKAPELLSEDLRLAHLALTDITGEFKADDLLGVIFSSFCIGK